jgi:hypothetical protein
MIMEKVVLNIVTGTGTGRGLGFSLPFKESGYGSCLSIP